MGRLTSDKKVSEMGMYELVHNSCYCHGGKARYRDFDSDIDARELAIQLLERYADIPNEFTCDDDFDMHIFEYISYGMEKPEGLIALFYVDLCAMADLYERLKMYENTGLTPEKILELDKEFSCQAKELMKYRAIGTIIECQKATEKQKAKKPQLYGDFEDGKLVCPRCGEDLMDLVGCGFNCCPYCGQTIENLEG